MNIWVSFGTGKSITYYHVNAIYEDLGKEKSLALPVFHSLNGCDTTSALFGRGKKSPWEAWNCFKVVTCAFTYIATHPFTQVGIDDEHFQLLERFIVILYDKARKLQHVDESRKQLFSQKGKTMEQLPPTLDALLLQHLKRVAFEAGIQCTSEQKEQHAPAPEGWGWTLLKGSQSWAPIWDVLPVASKACSEFVKCSC